MGPPADAIGDAATRRGRVSGVFRSAAQPLGAKVCAWRRRTLPVELLAPLADPGSPGIGRFAALLAAQVGERQRLARERERIDKERAHLDKERERLDKERDKREEALKQQLEALRAIERGILEREEKMRRRQK